jgi:hypothetical protein
VLLPATHKLPRGFWLLLLVLSSTINGLYCKQNNKRSNLDGVADGSWKLVKVEPKEIGTLSDLTQGVYSLQVSGGRSQSCGLGSGGMFVYFISFFIDCVYLNACACVQSSWDSTTGHALHHSLPSPLLVQ